MEGTREGKEGWGSIIPERRPIPQEKRGGKNTNVAAVAVLLPLLLRTTLHGLLCRGSEGGGVWNGAETERLNH